MTAKVVRNTIVFTLVWLMAAFFGAARVGADGTKTVCTTTYGGVTECREEEVPREEIVHEVVETGIVEDSVMLVALFVFGLVAILASKKVGKVRLG